MRRREFRPLSAALEAVTAGLAPATLLAEVQMAWPEAAGEAFAGASQPTSERDGVITVACESAVWAQELDLMSEPVVAEVHRRLGRSAVTALRPVARPSRR